MHFKDKFGKETMPPIATYLSHRLVPFVKKPSPSTAFGMHSSLVRSLTKEDLLRVDVQGAAGSECQRNLTSLPLHLLASTCTVHR